MLYFTQQEMLSFMQTKMPIFLSKFGIMLGKSFFNSRLQKSLPKFSFSTVVVPFLQAHFFYGRACSIWKFSGQGLNQGLQLLAYATATAMQDPSPVCNVHYSSWQRWILNPLSGTRDPTSSLHGYQSGSLSLSHYLNSLQVHFNPFKIHIKVLLILPVLFFLFLLLPTFWTLCDCSHLLLNILVIKKYYSYDLLDKNILNTVHCQKKQLRTLQPIIQSYFSNPVTHSYLYWSYLLKMG